MDPIKINIEISLQEATLAVIKALTEGRGGKAVASEPKTAKNATKIPAVIETKVEEPAPAQDDPAQVPAENTQAEEITDAQLREAVKDCKSRVSVAEIRNSIFAKYGIESSVECPASRRPGLLHDLKTYQSANA